MVIGICPLVSKKTNFPLLQSKYSREALYFDNLTPAVRVTARTDERPAAHATTQRGQQPLPVSENATCAGRPLAWPLCTDSVRAYNETPETGLRTRPQGCPWVEISRDPWYTPVRVAPDPARTVPTPAGVRVRMRREL